MKRLFQNDEVDNEAADASWKNVETDKLLDMFLAGSTPANVAHALKRNPKAIKRRVEQFRCNERDVAVNYRPTRRISRKKARLTENDRMIIAAHRKRDVPIAVTACVLMRDVSELDPGERGRIKENTVLAPTLDLILALRYSYHVYQKPLVSDKVYDDLVTEEIEYGGGASVLQNLGEPKDCPHRVKTLALYLAEKYEDDGKGDGIKPIKK